MPYHHYVSILHHPVEFASLTTGQAYSFHLAMPYYNNITIFNDVVFAF